MKLRKKFCSEQAKLFATAEHNVGDEVYFPYKLPTVPEGLQDFEAVKGTINAVILYSTSVSYRITYDRSPDAEVPAKFVVKTKAELLNRIVDDVLNRWKSNYEYANSKLEKEGK